MSNHEDEEIISEFIEESEELLDALDIQFVALESESDPTKLIAEIFRAAHTIKGAAGLLGYQRLERIAHAGESVLAKLRDGKLSLDAEITSALLQMVDAIREILESIKADRSEGENDYPELLEALTAILEGRSSIPVAAAVAAEEEDLGNFELLIPAAMAAKPAPAPAPAPPKAERKEPIKHQDLAARIDTNVKVGVGLLDQLMNLVGELVLARNQVIQSTAQIDDAALNWAAQRLNMITTELQEGIMKTRMQPIGTVWTKFPRLIRDLALECGKQVQLEQEGRETELDRTIIEAIRDPLIHIVRNSIDHGIEPADVRKRAGKPAMGTIRFRAFHEGGMVNIEITDDGRGIDPQLLRDKAVERNMMSPQRAAALSDREAMQLLFMPSFSTAERVTKVSGRGVGMDVVKTSIERIGGMVDVSSKVGLETSIRVKIPLTLAIIPALIVGCGEHRFAIPQINLLELVGLGPSNKIEFIRRTPVYYLRGELLPLIYLDELIGGERPDSRSEGNILVLQGDERNFGLVVSSVNDTQEIVVKPLGRELKSIPIFAGATIMGDGKVALILDVFGIANLAGMGTDHDARLLEEAEQRRGEEASVQTLLVFRTVGGARMAILHEAIDRLEKFSAKQVERVGERAMVQYGDRILPLIGVEELLGAGATDWSDPLEVVVCSNKKRAVGLVVDRIDDIVEERLVVESDVKRSGVLGCAVVQGAVTELLDVSCAWDHL